MSSTWLLPHERVENERLSAGLPGNNGRNVDTCSNDDRLNVTRQRSDTREGIEREQYLETGASMRSTDRAGTRDRVYAADKRCTRARVLSLSNTLTTHSARRSGILSFHELVPSPPPPPLPPSPRLPRCHEIGTGNGFLRPHKIRKFIVTVPYIQPVPLTDNNTPPSLPVNVSNAYPCPVSWQPTSSGETPPTARRSCPSREKIATKKEGRKRITTDSRSGHSRFTISHAHTTRK